jgi:hypothetical protein
MVVVLLEEEAAGCTQLAYRHVRPQGTALFMSLLFYFSYETRQWRCSTGIRNKESVIRSGKNVFSCISGEGEIQTEVALLPAAMHRRQLRIVFNVTSEQ